MTEQSPNASEAYTGDVIQLQATVDKDQLWSISKNYLQCRLTAETHSRNVFINKNERFLHLS